MLKRRLSGVYCLGVWIWLYVRGPFFVSLIDESFPVLRASGVAPVPELCEVSKRLYARQEEIGAASHRRKSWQTSDPLPNRPLRNGHVIGAVLGTYKRVSFVA